MERRIAVLCKNLYRSIHIPAFVYRERSRARKAQTAAPVVAVDIHCAQRAFALDFEREVVAHHIGAEIKLGMIEIAECERIARAVI